MQESVRYAKNMLYDFILLKKVSQLRFFENPNTKVLKAETFHQGQNIELRLQLQLSS